MFAQARANVSKRYRSARSPSAKGGRLSFSHGRLTQFADTPSECAFLAIVLAETAVLISALRLASRNAAEVDIDFATAGDWHWRQTKRKGDGCIGQTSLTGFLARQT